jgi:hypothetical protein
MRQSRICSLCVCVCVCVCFDRPCQSRCLRQRSNVEVTGDVDAEVIADMASNHECLSVMASKGGGATNASASNEDKVNNLRVSVSVFQTHFRFLANRRQQVPGDVSETNDDGSDLCRAALLRRSLVSCMLLVRLYINAESLSLSLFPRAVRADASNCDDASRRARPICCRSTTK